MSELSLPPSLRSPLQAVGCFGACLSSVGADHVACQPPARLHGTLAAGLRTWVRRPGADKGKCAWATTESPRCCSLWGRQEVAACIRGRSWQLASFGTRVGEQGSGCISSSFLTATWVFITSHASDFSKMIALLLCFKDGSVKTHLNILTQTEEFIPSDGASMTHLSLSSLFVRQT